MIRVYEDLNLWIYFGTLFWILGFFSDFLVFFCIGFWDFVTFFGILGLFWDFGTIFRILRPFLGF